MRTRVKLCARKVYQGLSFRRGWWLALTIAFTVMCAIRWSYWESGQTTEIDIGLFGAWLILLALPLVDEISFSGFSIKKVIERTAQEAATQTLQLMKQHQFQSQGQIINFHGDQIPPAKKLKRLTDAVPDVTDCQDQEGLAPDDALETAPDGTPQNPPGEPPTPPAAPPAEEPNGTPADVGAEESGLKPADHRNDPLPDADAGTDQDGGRELKPEKTSSPGMELEGERLPKSRPKRLSWKDGPAESDPSIYSFLNVRIKLERAVFSLAEMHDMPVGPGASVTQLAQRLVKRQIIPPALAELIQAIYSICSAAIHGRYLTADQKKFVNDTHKSVINSLRSLM